MVDLQCQFQVYSEAIQLYFLLQILVFITFLTLIFLKCASHCGGFSCCRARALGHVVLVVAAPRLNSCGARAQLFHSMSDLPGSIIEPMSPALAGGFFTTEPPVQLSSVASDSFRPHELQHTRPPCPSPTPRIHPNPCPLSR